MAGVGAVVIASTNGAVGIDAAWEVLAGGGSALDAVEAGVRQVEANRDDHTVGLGGYPNLLGQVELDASIMDGATRAAGAVGALRGHVHAVTVARAVMERLPHVLVVGDGAARLARQLGLAEEDLLTAEAESVWRDGVEGRRPGGAAVGDLLARVAELTADPERPGHVAGTVDFIARDRAGHLASAVSTSGWAWKFPGRLGDSPLVGAGNYCDDRHGAAACTGWGELAIRAGTARMVVAGLQAGRGLRRSVEEAFADLTGLAPSGTVPVMDLVAMDPDGHHLGASSRTGATYVHRSEDDAGPVTSPKLHIPIQG
ncbi:MAG TPA: isoaspartyl peptidase/L-asparaginase [Acidimicrobiales bacterium]|nr:isoaspartyl peptidase/L-asparaginase [Acidimicrobiales bacterium]